ncbi:MAG: VWA domain-containing protein [bacterium]|nr:VWA domain-containing protein [bacterium]
MPFLLQLLILGVLVAVLLFQGATFVGIESPRLGVWLVVDTSASMSTTQGKQNRMVLARQEAGRVLDRVTETAGDLEVCYRLSALDMERRDILTSNNAAGIRQALQTLQHRTLGTDLSLVRTLAGIPGNSQKEKTSTDCTITHLVVISDSPAPPWVAEKTAIPVTWRDVGTKVNNTGISIVNAARNPLSGQVLKVNVEIAAYGDIPQGARLRVTAPDGTQVLEQELSAWRENIGYGNFIPTDPGLYSLNLLPADGYLYDNTAVIEVSEDRQVRVDWQLTDTRLLNRLGWESDSKTPYLSVVSGLPTVADFPTLVVGEGYRRGSAPDIGAIEIRDFIEDCPLLEDLNFDVAESLGIRGIDLPEGYEPVLRGNDGRVWLALREEPLSAYVPGLPMASDDAAGRFSAAVFFNALRLLLKERKFPPLYTLTTPYQPDPEGKRLVLHKGEGNTYRENVSYGDLNQLEPVVAGGADAFLWPLLLAAALLVFLLERLHAVGVRFRRKGGG